MSTTIAELGQNLQELLIQDADAIGRTSGFIQRQRKFKGSSFAQSLIFGWQANPDASLEELCQSACVSGVRVSPQGLQDRLNSPQAATFMRQLLERALSYVVASQAERTDLLARFAGVYIQDSTVIDLPRALRAIWAGCGNHRSPKAGTMAEALTLLRLRWQIELLFQTLAVDTWRNLYSITTMPYPKTQNTTRHFSTLGSRFCLT